MHKPQSGFTFIELVILLTILSIIGSAVMLGYVNSIKHLPKIHRQDLALSLAQGRMEFILGQFYDKGFENASDLCTTTPGLAACSVPTGFTISSSITSNYNGNSEMKLITVTTSGAAEATLTTLVTDHR